jgi:hypothetical protein
VAQPSNTLQESMETVLFGGVTMKYAYASALFEGVTSVTLDISLPRNALVDKVELLVGARRVDSTDVQQVAQVRSYSSTGGHELVIDFGTPRTVCGIDLPAGASVLAVHAWLGSQFAPSPAYARSATGSPAATSNALFAELRTERLRVLISRGLSDAELAAVTLRLPEPPSGLEIRIDSGPPAWTHPEPVQPRADVVTPDAAGWNSESKRIVPLTEALAALAGDPLAADDAVDFKLTLSTKIPCQLSLALHGTPLWRRWRRVRFDGSTTTTLEFDGEGAIDLPLLLPVPPAGPARRIDELRWVAAAELPPWRALPPLGPDAALDAVAAPLAELRVSPDRAVCVRLSGRGGLAELTAVRLPLRADGDGAEVRVVLWSVAGDVAGALPLAPLPQGASDPVTLAAGAGEQWVSFSFAKPVPVDSAAMPWLALVVARGELAWSLARPSGLAGDPVDEQLIRRGPPNGPWKAMPATLQDPLGLLDARARLRLVGHAPKDRPLAPLTLALAGQPASELDPGAKGRAGALGPSLALNIVQPALRLVSRTAGSVVLRDVDVISNN